MPYVSNTFYKLKTLKMQLTAWDVEDPAVPPESFDPLTSIALLIIIGFLMFTVKVLPS
jgi:hypothetical protein